MSICIYMSIPYVYIYMSIPYVYIYMSIPFVNIYMSIPYVYYIYICNYLQIINPYLPRAHLLDRHFGFKGQISNQVRI